MSSSLDDVEQKCNELMEMAVSVTWLEVYLRDDLSITVDLATKGRPSRQATFPIETPGTTPEVHRRVFSTLARIVEGNGVSNVNNVSIQVSNRVDGHNQTGTHEMTPFLQSIAGSSTIQWLNVGADSSIDGDSSDSSVDTEQSDNTSQPTNMAPMVAALAANLTSPHSVLNKLYLHDIHFDDELLTVLCEAISSRESRLVSLEFDDCRFPTLGPLWSALATNESISNLDFGCLGLEEETVGDIYGSQQVQEMLETNMTMTKLNLDIYDSPFPNSFLTALGNGLGSNTTLKAMDLTEINPSQHGYINALFEGGLDRNTGLERLSLKLKDLSAMQELVSGLDRMAKQSSTKGRSDGSGRVSTLKRLFLTFHLHLDDAECVMLALDCLIRNRAYFALEELHFVCSGGNSDKDNVECWNKLAAAIQACPSLTTFHMNLKNVLNDSRMETVANSLENNTKMTRFQTGGLRANANLRRRNDWNPSANPNHTRILCSIVRNIRELPLFVESSKRSLLPLVLRRLLKPTEFETEKVVNLNHAFHLIQNLPELFSS